MGSADLVTPIASSNGNNWQLGQSYSPANGSSHFLWAFNAQTNMPVGITNSHKSLKNKLAFCVQINSFCWPWNGFSGRHEFVSAQAWSSRPHLSSWARWNDRWSRTLWWATRTGKFPRGSWFSRWRLNDLVWLRVPIPFRPPCRDHDRVHGHDLMEQNNVRNRRGAF